GWRVAGGVRAAAAAGGWTRVLYGSRRQVWGHRERGPHTPRGRRRRYTHGRRRGERQHQGSAGTAAAGRPRRGSVRPLGGRTVRRTHERHPRKEDVPLDPDPGVGRHVFSAGPHVRLVRSGHGTL